MFETLKLSQVFSHPFGGLWLHGVALTALITAGSWLLAVVMGLMVALLRISDSAVLRWLGSAYVSFQQNIPILVHILFWYFGISALLPAALQDWLNTHNGELILSAIAIGLCMGAYMSEALRSGFRAVPHGQYEAAQALGLNYVQTMAVVVVPQAFRVALPPFISHTVLLFKNTSLAMAIGVAEMTYSMKYIETASFLTTEVYLTGAAFYLAVSMAIMGAGAMLERKLNVSGRGA